MQVPVGWKASAAHEEDLEFKCRLCGHQARAHVFAVGSGEGSFFFGGLARARGRAKADARSRVSDKIQRTRCPKCGKRDPRVVQLFAALHALALAALAAPFLYMLSIPMIVVGGLAMWFASKAVRNWWRELDQGIRWLD